ncbi:hypothetical protein DASC09_012960 [Saccharomycopsis crataegensis]|uniref:Wings apart-like protein C-terminal domain-containing protein n=1 Tax=Saccharomycopsis crataegensis TaxID=43959 RepID=A0AAV5QH23_9ASCO|nr:hypothetical protein DASC09_012960 [Saccharomycopsis crataegensis]
MTSNFLKQSQMKKKNEHDTTITPENAIRDPLRTNRKNRNFINRKHSQGSIISEEFEPPLKKKPKVSSNTNLQAAVSLVSQEGTEKISLEKPSREEFESPSSEQTRTCKSGMGLRSSELISKKPELVKNIPNDKKPNFSFVDHTAQKNVKTITKSPTKENTGMELEAWELFDSILEVNSVKTQTLKLTDKITSSPEFYDEGSFIDESQLDQSDEEELQFHQELSQNLLTHFSTGDEHNDHNEFEEQKTENLYSQESNKKTTRRYNNKTYGGERTYLEEPNSELEDNDEPYTSSNEDAISNAITSVDTTKTQKESRLKNTQNMKESRTFSRLSDDLNFMLADLSSKDINLKRSAILEMCLRIAEEKQDDKDSFIKFLRVAGLPASFYYSVALTNDPVLFFCFGFIINEMIATKDSNDCNCEFLLLDQKIFFLFKYVIIQMLDNSESSILSESVKIRPKLSKISKISLTEVVRKILIKKFFASDLNFLQTGKLKHHRGNIEDTANTSKLNSFFFAMNILNVINQAIDSGVLSDTLEIANSLNFDSGIISKVFHSITDTSELDLLKTFKEGLSDREASANILMDCLDNLSPFGVINYLLCLNQCVYSFNFNVRFKKIDNFGQNIENIEISSTNSGSSEVILDSLFNNKSKLNSIFDSFLTIINLTDKVMELQLITLSNERKEKKDSSNKLGIEIVETIIILLNCYLNILKILITLTSNIEKLFEHDKRGFTKDDEIYRRLFDPNLAALVLSIIGKIRATDNFFSSDDGTSNDQLDSLFSSLSLFSFGYLMNVSDDVMCFKKLSERKNISQLTHLFQNCELRKNQLPLSKELIVPNQSFHATGYLCLIIGLLVTSKQDYDHSVLDLNDYRDLSICLDNFMLLIPSERGESDNFAHIRSQIKLVADKINQQLK